MCHNMVGLLQHCIRGQCKSPNKQNFYAEIFRKIAIIFLFRSLNLCFACSNEPSQVDGSFKYRGHTFWLRNNKIDF